MMLIVVNVADMKHLSPDFIYKNTQINRSGISQAYQPMAVCVSSLPERFQ